MSEKIVHIRPLNPYVQDDGEQAWLCIDTRGRRKDSRYINIELDEVMAIDLLAQLTSYFARRIQR